MKMHFLQTAVIVVALALEITSTEGLKGKTEGGLQRLRKEEGRSLKGRKAPPPQKTTVGFTVSCGSKDAPGLDGDHPANVYYSFHLPGMSYVYESITKLDARSDPDGSGPAEPRLYGEDTKEVAQKIAQDLNAATLEPPKPPLLTQAQRDAIQVQEDGGGPGKTRARIVATGADHVNFGVDGDNGKVRWVALTDPPRVPPPKPVVTPVRYGGSATKEWPEDYWEDRERDRKYCNWPRIKPGTLVPSPYGKPQQESQKFKSTRGQNGKPPSKGDEHGRYIDENRGWINV